MGLLKNKSSPLSQSSNLEDAESSISPSSFCVIVTLSITEGGKKFIANELKQAKNTIVIICCDMTAS